MATTRSDLAVFSSLLVPSLRAGWGLNLRAVAPAFAPTHFSAAQAWGWELCVPSTERASHRGIAPVLANMAAGGARADADAGE
jgi:hypothetical protein